MKVLSLATRMGLLGPRHDPCFGAQRRRCLGRCKRRRAKQPAVSLMHCLTDWALATADPRRADVDGHDWRSIPCS